MLLTKEWNKNAKVNIYIFLLKKWDLSEYDNKNTKSTSGQHDKYNQKNDTFGSGFTYPWYFF